MGKRNMETAKLRLSKVLTIKNGKDYKHLQEGNVPVFGSGGYMCSVDSTSMTNQVYYCHEKALFQIYNFSTKENSGLWTLASIL